METLAKSDAFFFIASMAVILLTLISLVVLFYLVRLVRNIQYISKKIKEESNNISEDIGLIRERIREQGVSVGLGAIMSFAKRLFSSKTKKAKTTKAKTKSQAEDQG